MAITASKIAAMVAATTDGGFDIPQYVYNESNSATFKTGAVLVQSAGTLVEAATGVKTLIVGVAMQAGQNNAAAPAYPNYGGTYPAGLAQQGTSTAGTASAVFPLLVAPALPGTIFEATFASGGADVAINVTDLYVRYGLSKDATSGFWYVDKSLVTINSAVCIIGVKNPQDVTFGTTTGARVFFKFLADATLYGAVA